MNRLFEIAERLGQIARMRYRTHNALKVADHMIKDRELELAPEGGWPGKNADERKAAELTALKADKWMQERRLEKLDLEDKLEELEAEREALTEERDAIRWTIRDREQFACTGGSVLDALRDAAIHAADMNALTKAEMALHDEDQTEMENADYEGPVCPCGHAENLHEGRSGKCSKCECQAYVPF